MQSTESTFLTRAEAIAKIKAGLKKRSGKVWSVTGGKGTAYGWLTINVPPSKKEGWYMPEAARVELAKLLNLDCVHNQGVSIPSGCDFYREYIDRAEGRVPEKLGVAYWD